MKAYCFFDILEIIDPAKMEEYREHVAETVEHFGGRYLVARGRFDVMEGEWRPVFPVLLEFPSMEAARDWYASEEYAELKMLRAAAAKCTAVFMEGIAQ
jgi:uncharacterized protein (DUF1330 family)